MEEVDIDEEKQLTKKQLKIKKIRMDIKNRYIDLKPFEQFKVNPNEELVYHIVNIM